MNPDPDAAAGSTRIRWTNWGNEGGSGSHICCNSSDFPFNICSSLGGIEVPRYPAIPALTSFGGPYTEFSDQVFEGGYDSNWTVDQNHWVDGQRYGV